jgi:phage-related protein
MTKRKWHAKGWPATPMLAALISLGTPAVLHASPAQYQNQNTQPAHDSDITRQELAQFDQFLDSHREIAEQVRQNPSLVNNDEFVKGHPALQTFMQQHPAVREELKENPNAFMRQEARYDRHEDQRMHEERVHFDQFLDSHREVAEQLRKNPKLINDEAYVKGHPELQTYLQDHPKFRDAVRKDPDAFTRADNDRYARHDNDDRDRDARADNDRDRDARADNDNHDRDARNDNDARDRDARADNDRNRDARADNDARDRDARADNDNHDRDARTDKDNPDRDAHSGNDARDRDARADNDRDRDARRDNDNRYHQHDADDHDRDARRDELANFDHYLDSHRETAEQIRKDPSLVNNDEFVKSHPSLQTYLQQHPGVRSAIKQNPNAFMQQEARYDQNENRTRNGAGDEPHRHLGEFLGGHSSINEQLSKDPSLVKNDEYMQSHPELKDYLNQHPDVRQGLMQNPETFVKSSQQFNTTNKNGSYSGSTQTAPATGSKPATDTSKPKQ